jgi:hypothetical protein
MFGAYGKYRQGKRGHSWDNYGTPRCKKLRIQPKSKKAKEKLISLAFLYIYGERGEIVMQRTGMTFREADIALI